MKSPCDVAIGKVTIMERFEKQYQNSHASKTQIIVAEALVMKTYKVSVETEPSRSVST